MKWYERILKRAHTQTISGNNFKIEHNNRKSVYLTLTGSYTSDSTEAILAGTHVGQRLRVLVVSTSPSSATLLIRDAAGTNLNAGGTTSTGWYLSYGTLTCPRVLDVEWDGTYWCEVYRGQSNKLQGQNSGGAGGFNNILSGATTGIAGGNGCTLSGTAAGAAGGFNNILSGSYTGGAGGRRNTISGSYAVGSGYRALADKLGQHAHAANNIAATGDAQRSILVAWISATHSDNSWHSLYASGSSSYKLTIEEDTAWTFSILIVGATSGAAQSYSFKIEGLIKNAGGTTTLVTSTVTTIYNTDNTDIDAQVVANNTDDALDIQVQDSGGIPSGDTIRWVADVRMVEVTFP